MVDFPIDIQFHNVDHSEALETFIQQKAAKLNGFQDIIQHCRVTIEEPHRHHEQGNVFDVRLDISLPGDEIVINRDPGDISRHEHIHAAIIDSFRAAHRRVREWDKRRREREQGAQEVRPVEEEVPIDAETEDLAGEVVRLFDDTGYAMARLHDGREVFFSDAVLTDARIDDVMLGQYVRLDIGDTSRGETPYAGRVRLVRADEPVPELEGSSA